MLVGVISDYDLFSSKTRTFIFVSKNRLVLILELNKLDFLVQAEDESLAIWLIITSVTPRLGSETSKDL